jgi:hypothetical protein
MKKNFPIAAAGSNSEKILSSVDFMHPIRTAHRDFIQVIGARVEASLRKYYPVFFHRVVPPATSTDLRGAVYRAIRWRLSKVSKDFSFPFQFFSQSVLKPN